MKKYLCFIVSLLYFIFIFLNGWFGDYLGDLLTPFLYPLLILLPLLIGYCICFVVIIIMMLKKPKNIWNYISVGILTVTAFFFLFFPFREVRTKVELKLYEKDRDKVVEMVKENKLSTDDLGNAKLPKRYKKVSIGGEVFIYQNDKEGTVISFWIFRGMLSGSEELVYSTKGESLIRKREAGHPILNIKKVKDNWYYVVTDY